jgi:hypothetical protein
MNIQLLPEAVLTMQDEEVRRRFQALEHRYCVDIEDELYGAAFRHYVLLTHWPSLLCAASEMTPEAVFYNRYYWLLKFVKLYICKHGFDAGSEQQVLQLLERADCDVDWLILQQIEQQVEKEVQVSDS